MNFVALDFETASCAPDSACALGIVRVEHGRVTARRELLLKPPPGTVFTFTWLHGISAGMVAREPTFAEAWPEISLLLNGVDFIAAHNAPFDRRVLAACCDHYGLARPGTPFRCTVRVARHCWGFRPANLAYVCHCLEIALDHHRALSDAEACARIVCAALDEPAGQAALDRALVRAPLPPAV